MGFLWGFFKPLLYLLIFIVIFSSQMSIHHYVLYATSGLIFWFFFANVTNQSVASILGSSAIIKSLSIPLVIFPFSELLSELFNFLLTVFVFLVIMHWFGLQYNAKLVLILPCMLLFSIFSLGITLALSSLNVFFRDIGILWAAIQPAIFYLTPIAYSEKMISPKYSAITRFNPIYYFIKLARAICYDDGNPSYKLWLYCCILALVTYLIGAFIFNSLKRQFISAI